MNVFLIFQLDISHSILLTGTPVQNNLKELYALLSFVAPNIFRNKYADDFVSRYSDIGEEKKGEDQLPDFLEGNISW